MSSTLLEFDTELPGYVQDGSIMSPQDVGFCFQSVDLLAKAKARSVEIEEEAQQEFEHQKKAGYEQGLQDGKAAAAAHNLTTVLASLDYYEQSKEQLVKVVISCLRQMIMELPAEERIYQLVGGALQTLKQQPRIVLQINPQDHAAVDATMSRLQGLLSSDSILEVRMRDDLAPGSSILESPLGLIDGSLESQLSILEASLRKVVKE